MTDKKSTKSDREKWSDFVMWYDIEIKRRQKEWDTHPLYEHQRQHGAKTFSKAINQVLMDKWKISYYRRERWVELGWLTAKGTDGFGTEYTPVTPSISNQEK